MKNVKLAKTLMLFLTLSILSVSPLSLLIANAATGLILINSTTPSAPGQKVPAGGNVSLYFGQVTWSGAQFYLLLSTNGFSEPSGTQYSPTFAVGDLTGLDVLTFTNANGTWTVGMNWVNGSIPINMAGGNYYIKAYDGGSVAVTNTYITITGALNVSPTSGPAGVNISLNGNGFAANSYINLSYYNTTSPFNKIPIANLVQANNTGKFNYTMTAPDAMQVLPEGDQTPAWTIITFNAKSSAEEYNGTYSEQSRGLKQIDTSIANGLWGNGTDLATLKQIGQTIRLVGRYFYPGTANILWEGTTNIGTVIVNANGDFDTNITVPQASGMDHWMVIQDADNVTFYVRVYVVHVVDSYEPDNSFTQYSTMTVTTSLQSQSRSIVPPGDNDYIRFSANLGTYIFYTNSSINTYAYLYTENGTQLAYNDDGQGNLQFRINYTITNIGYYFLRVLDNNAAEEGPYTLFFQYFDTIPPVTFDDYDFTWQTSDFSINLNAVDIGSGVTETYYRVNSGLIQTIRVNGQPLITSEGANNTLEYWSIDVAGNEELPHEILTGIKLDKTPPTGSILINQAAAYTNVTGVNLTLLATDTISGISQMRLSNDGIIWTTWENYKTAKSWTLLTGDGEKMVYAQFLNNAGFMVTAYDTITLDTTLPVANAGQNLSGQIGQNITFNGAASTDNTGIASYLWNFGDGTTGTGISPTHTYSNVGNYTVTLTVKDFAGNSAASSSTIAVQVIIPELPSASIVILFFVLTSILAVMYRGKVKLKKHAR